jgi:hypothetical protein
MAAIRPFANESDALDIGGLTIENRTDRVSVYGSIDLTRDKRGLEHARALGSLMDSVIKALEAEKQLPEQVAPPVTPEEVKNPFA